ncbi:MAG: AAA family ATPase, partial [Deltaproteobacteria bacterium]|nr:AAA family ATPase [Deltaproteobacteria bacterium]
KAIARGVREGAFGYYAGTPPTLGENGKYQVNESKVAYEKAVADDEVDLDMGFIMMPDAIPIAKLPESPIPETEPLDPQPPVPEPPGPEPLPPGPTEEQKRVSITFTADRDQLFGAWQAVANLADMAGKVSVSIDAESEEGFDKNKLRNAVIEPLQEADLIE